MDDLTCSAGSDRCFHASRNADFVHRACLRYVQNREVANDLTQEILLKVAYGKTKFSGAGQSRTWLYRVTVNHCLDHLRREKRIRGQAEIYAAEWRLEVDTEVRESPFDLVEDENRTSHQVLMRLKASAGETDRHVIFLRFDIGMSHTGIAEILGVSRAAVGQRLTRIHARAAALWQELEEAKSVEKRPAFSHPGLDKPPGNSN